MNNNNSSKAIENLNNSFNSIERLLQSMKEEISTIDVSESFRKTNESKEFSGLLGLIINDFGISDEEFKQIKVLFLEEVFKIIDSFKQEVSTSHFPTIIQWFNSLVDSLAAKELILREKEKEELKIRKDYSLIAEYNKSRTDEKVRLAQVVAKYFLGNDNKRIELKYSSQQQFSDNYYELQNRNFRKIFFLLTFRLFSLFNDRTVLFNTFHLSYNSQARKIESLVGLVKNLEMINDRNLILAQDNVVLDNENNQLKQSNLELKVQVDDLSRRLVELQDQQTIEEELPSYQENDDYSYFHLNMLLLLNSSRSFVPFRSYSSVLDTVQASILASRLSNSLQAESFFWSSIIAFWLISTNYTLYKLTSKLFRFIRYIFSFFSSKKKNLKEKVTSKSDSHTDHQ